MNKKLFILGLVSMVFILMSVSFSSAYYYGGYSDRYDNDYRSSYSYMGSRGYGHGSYSSGRVISYGKYGGNRYFSSSDYSGFGSRGHYSYPSFYHPVHYNNYGGCNVASHGHHNYYW